MAARGTLVAFTVACVLLLAARLRLLVTPGRRDPARWLVLAACGALVGAVMSRDWLSLTGHDSRTSFELGLLLSAALVGTAALDLARHRQRRGARTRRVRPSRRGPVVLILGALLVAPAMVIGRRRDPRRLASRWSIVAAGATLMSLLLAARLVVLLNRSERLTRRARAPQHGARPAGAARPVVGPRGLRLRLGRDRHDLEPGCRAALRLLRGGGDRPERLRPDGAARRRGQARGEP